MEKIKVIFLVVGVLAGTLANAQSNNNFIDDDNQYWTSVSDNYVFKGMPSCQALINEKSNDLLITFTQYKKDSLKAAMVVPPKSPARLNASAAGMSNILSMDRKTYINKYVNVVESGNAFTVTYTSGGSPTKLVDSYVYEPSKNIRYYVALQPADASLQLAIDNAKKKGLPGSKEVKCTGPI